MSVLGRCVQPVSAWTKKEPFHEMSPQSEGGHSDEAARWCKRVESAYSTLCAFRSQAAHQHMNDLDKNIFARASSLRAGAAVAQTVNSTNQEIYRLFVSRQARVRAFVCGKSSDFHCLMLLRAHKQPPPRLWARLFTARSKKSRAVAVSAAATAATTHLPASTARFRASAPA